MRKLIILALAVAMLVACAQTENVPAKAVRELCVYMVQVYPQATLQDLYKTCYQDFFGAEHAISDTASARKYLRYELNELRNEGVNELRMPLREPTGFRHRFVRANLRLILTDSVMTENELFDAFMAAANTSAPVRENWADEWAQIESIALQVHPAWTDPELQALLREAAKTNSAVHHSEAFRQAYHPHYRIIPNP